MSFITLKTQNRQGREKVQSIDAAYIRNEFKTGLELKKGDTMSLVNMTINKQADYAVNGTADGGGNNRIVFRLGTSDFAEQRIAEIKPGNYAGVGLAGAVSNALNEAVVPGVFKRWVDNAGVGGAVQHGFDCTFDGSNPIKQTFEIRMSQQPVPTIINENIAGEYSIVETAVGGNEAFNPLNMLDPGTIPAGPDPALGTTEIAGPFRGNSAHELNKIDEIWSAPRGIFLNGGKAELTSEAVKGLPTDNWTNVAAKFEDLYVGGAASGASPLVANDWVAQWDGDTPFPGTWLNSDSQTMTITTTSPAQLALGWHLKLVFVTPQVDGNTEYFLHYQGLDVPGKDQGAFAMGTDGTANGVLVPSWDAPVPYWWFDGDEVGASPKRLAGALTRAAQLVRESDTESFHEWEIFFNPTGSNPNGQINATTNTPIGQIRSELGFCRQQLYNGVGTGDANQMILPGPKGTDYKCYIEPGDGVAGSGNEMIPTISFSRIVARAGVGGYPATGWRDGIRTGLWGAATLLNDANVFGASYLVSDNIKLECQIDKLNSFIFRLYRSTVGAPGTWIEAARPITSTTASTGPFIVGQDGDLTKAVPSNIKERHFGLRPVYGLSAGGFYQRARYRASGINDRDDYADHSDSLTSTASDERDEGYLAEDEVYVDVDGEEGPVGAILGAPINALQTLFKFGHIDVGSYWKANTAAVGNPPNNLIPAIDFTPPGTTNDLLGFYFPAIAAGGTVPERSEGAWQRRSTFANTFPLGPSQQVPVGSDTSLTMVVELIDFNITGKIGGDLGDDAKIIAVVPQQELQVSVSTGANILHYEPSNLIPIELNIAQDQTVYSLTAVLRNMDGKIVSTLEPSTFITLLHKRGESEKLAEALAGALERREDMMANRQGSQIANIGVGMPLVRPGN